MSEDIAHIYLTESLSTIEGFWEQDQAQIEVSFGLGGLTASERETALNAAWDKRLRLEDNAWATYYNRIGI